MESASEQLHENEKKIEFLLVDKNIEMSKDVEENRIYFHDKESGKFLFGRPVYDENTDVEIILEITTKTIRMLKTY